MACLRILITLLLFSGFRLYCVDIGSDTTVDRFTTQQTLLNGDRIAGFALLEAGFRLDNPVTVGIFDSFFSVSGPIALNGGILDLDRDLVLADLSQIRMLGKIVGDYHSLELAQSTTCIIDAPEAIKEAEIFEVDRISPSNINNVEALSWSFDSRFVGIGGDDFFGSDDIFIVYQLIDNTLFFRDSAIPGTPGGPAGEINEVCWHPSAYLVAVVTRTDASVDEISIYSFNPTAGLLSVADTQSYAGNVNAAAWHTSGNYLAIGSVLDSGEIVIYPVNSSGIINAAGALIVNIVPSRDVQLESIDWDKTGSYLAVGLAANGLSPEILVYEFNDEPSLSLTLNASLFVNQSVSGLDWNQTYSNLLAVGFAGFSGNLVRLYEHDTGGTLTEIVGIPGIGATIGGIDWHPDGEVLGLSTQFFGGVGKVQTYFFDEEQQTFELVSNFNFADDVEALEWTPDGKYIASGSDNNLLVVYALPKNLGFAFENLKVYLSNNTILKDSDITFQGECILNGRGSSLEIMPTSNIIIDSGASLLIKDICIKGIRENNIRCLDQLSSISFENVHWILDDNYSFTIGYFSVCDEFKISGTDSTFAYQSDVASYINEESTLILDKNVTFSYDPPNVKRDLIVFFAETAQLFLNGATLHSTATGLQLKKGTLILGDNSFFSSEAKVPFEGITLGGATKEDNITLKWLGDSGLNILSGFVRYQNSNS